ncbi:UNVERIFIED_CONTAM: protein NSP-INTERACTING kinase [Sesamum radiatum]|uniref:Protein NSP-INTERACTING kinase n=1 Tax=Sesamum radiatum TaxID=300843 RepID=A0AAW2L8R9_SESRA
MDQSAFLGNPKLCGAPLRPCHHENGISNGLELGSRRAQKLAWVLILCAVIVLFIVAAVFGVLYFKRGSKGQWKMIAFNGLPQFTAKDVLRSFNYVEGLETLPTLPDSISKVVLPTGITVSAKKIEWEPKEMKVMLQILTRVGNARHKNLTRLLGVCYNNHVAYLLYDYLPNGNLAEKIRMRRDWETKCKIVTRIARALCFLHHDCCPAIPHGNLKASNVLFDENMEPHLAEYGLALIIGSSNSPLPEKIRKETGGYRASITGELHMDVYNFGELILEVLTNGRLANASETARNSQREDLVREVAVENDIVHSSLFQDEVKSAIEIALLCTRSRPSDRPSMQEALKLLSTGLKSATNGRPLGTEAHKT